jgi:hypothetical protein
MLAIETNDQSPATPTRNEVEIDKGAMARERVQKRSLAYAVRRILFRIFLMVLVALVGTGVITYAMAMKTMTKATVTDYRECSWQVGKLEITGRRSYTYPYTEVFGHRFLEVDRVSESTIINLPREATTVVGVSQGKKWTGDQQMEGPAGTMKLQRADTYVIVSGKNYGAFEYEAFCTQHPRETTSEQKDH